MRRRDDAGSRPVSWSSAGRRSAAPSARANSALVTGAGAVAFTGPVSDGVAMMWAISRTRSSRSIHDIHCRPLPNGPPSPSSNGSSSRLSIPPSTPSTRPMRNRTTRTPRRCAFLASCSQASQRRCEKQRLPPSNSVSVSSCHRPYQPIAEPLISTAGRCCSRAIRRTTARVTRSRDDRIWRRLRRVQSVPVGSPARLITASIRASSAICTRFVTIRSGGRSVAAFTGSRVSTVTSCPALASASTKRRPMKPVPPVTSTRWRDGSASTSAVAWLGFACRRESRCEVMTPTPDTTPSAAASARSADA